VEALTAILIEERENAGLTQAGLVKWLGQHQSLLRELLMKN
jgi:hypothetical protein